MGLRRQDLISLIVALDNAVSIASTYDAILRSNDLGHLLPPTSLSTKTIEILSRWKAYYRHDATIRALFPTPSSVHIGVGSNRVSDALRLERNRERLHHKRTQLAILRQEAAAASAPSRASRASGASHVSGTLPPGTLPSDNNPTNPPDDNPLMTFSGPSLSEFFATLARKGSSNDPTST